MKASILAFSAILAAATASALTIDVSTTIMFTQTKPITDSTGTPVSAGNRVMIGTFDTTGFASAADYFTSMGTDLASLWGDFSTVSTSLTPTALGDKDGQFASAGLFPKISVNSTITGSPLAGTDVYLWILETADDSANLAIDFSNVTEFGIFSSSAANWTFLAADLPTDKITLRTSEVDLVYVGSNNGTSLALSTALTTVPEPSTYAALAGLAAGFLAWRKRRK